MRTDSLNEPNVMIPKAPAPLAGDVRSRAAAKAAQTSLRHKQDRRTEMLEQIRAQLADGTLVVRQMTVAQHAAASQAASRTLARNQARRGHNRLLNAVNARLDRA